MLAPDPPAFTVPDIGFVREGMIRMTPAQAGAVLRMCQHPRQRRISTEHVSVLAEMMRRDQWQPKSQIDFGRLGRRLVLVNGHHRMHAQIAAGRDILWSVAIHESQTEDDLNHLYCRFDTNVRKRSRENIAQGADLTAALGVRAQFAAAALKASPVIAAGLSMARDNEKYRMVGLLAQEAMNVAKDYAEELRLYEAWSAGASARLSKGLRSAGVMSVALVTMRHQPQAAARFWPAIVADDGLRRGDPRKTLLWWMAERSLERRTHHEHQLLVAGRCWNAFFNGEQLTMLKPHFYDGLPLAGTPFTVGRAK